MRQTVVIHTAVDCCASPADIRCLHPGPTWLRLRPGGTTSVPTPATGLIVSAGLTVQRKLESGRAWGEGLEVMSVLSLVYADVASVRPYQHCTPQL